MLPWFQNGRFPLFLAPMARYTDVMFRGFCKAQGADVMVTEFVFADALVREDPRVWDKVDFTAEQRPMGIQIFGSREASMARAAQVIADRLGPDFIDINFGCPADRITCMEAGSSMLRNPGRLERVTRAVVDAVPGVPVTVKIRTGWDASSIVAPEVAGRVVDAGAQALTIHGRTKEQGYRGEADWELIDRIARELPIPVVCNGTIRTAADVLHLRDHTACAGAMIGRAALGYPWIFSVIKHSLETGTPAEPPDLEERWRTILDYTRGIVERPLNRERHGGDLRWMRPKFIALTKEMPGSKKLRVALGTVRSIDDLERIAAEHRAAHTDVHPVTSRGSQATRPL